MVALFDLLTKIILTIPAFQGILLSSYLQRENPEDKLTIIVIIQQIVIEQLVPDRLLDQGVELPDCILTLLESLCFNPSPGSIEQCVFFPTVVAS